MNQFLIDSDWAVDALYGIEQAVETLVDLAPQGLAVSVITYAELYEGAAYSRTPESALRGLHRFLADKDLLPLTPAIAEQFATVRGALPRQLRQQIGDMDLLIAATALTYGLTVLTRNLKDFRHIPGLALYQAG